MSGKSLALAIAFTSLCLLLGGGAAQEWWDAAERPPATTTAVEPEWQIIRHPTYDGLPFFSRPELGAILWEVRGKEGFLMRRDPFQISYWRVLLDPASTRSIGTVDAVPTGGGRFVLLPRR